MANKTATVHLHVDGIPEIKARIDALAAVLADRERELLELKGPCSNKVCRLHYAHSGPCGPARVVEKRPTTIYEVSDGPKMLRETLCVAQTRIGASGLDSERTREHVLRLQRLIDECDRHRPLGQDGKHRDLHTPTCGCEDEAKLAAPCEFNQPQPCPLVARCAGGTCRLRSVGGGGRCTEHNKLLPHFRCEESERWLDDRGFPSGNGSEQ